MQPVTRSTLRAGSTLRPQLQHQARRHASHGSHGSGPTSEPLGAAFYIAAGAVPVSIAIYTISRQGTDEVPYFTRYITDTYSHYATKWAKRNDIHTQGVEQAAADRALFLNDGAQHQKWVDVRYPEHLNAGSPYNVQAGQGSINLDKVIAKYRKDAQEHDDLRRQQLREGKVPIEQTYEPEWKIAARKD